jgi:hypothetical protein
MTAWMPSDQRCENRYDIVSTSLIEVWIEEAERFAVLALTEYDGYGTILP